MCGTPCWSRRTRTSAVRPGVETPPSSSGSEGAHLVLQPHAAGQHSAGERQQQQKKKDQEHAAAPDGAAAPPPHPQCVRDSSREHCRRNKLVAGSGCMGAIRRPPTIPPVAERIGASLMATGIGYIPPWRLAGGNDPVHAEILHHLTVVIHGVGDAEGGGG